VSCEFYERLTSGLLARLLNERGDRFFKVVKLLAGAVPFVSSLADVAELVADLSRPGLAGELVELINAAKAAGQCDEEAKRAAEKLGVSENWLRTLAKNLAALPEIDLSQLEERLRRLKEGLDLLRRLSPYTLDLGKVFAEEGGRLLVNTPFGPVEYVEVGVEGRVREALSRGRVAVVYGPRGVGKSTAALKAIYDFAKAQQGRAVVVLRVGKDWKEALQAAVQLRVGPFVPVLYYDTLEAGGYTRRGEGVDVMYSAMAYAKSLADFLHDAALLGVPTVVVLAEEDYRAYEDAAKAVDVETVRLGGEAEALVVGILKDLKEGERRVIAETILEKYKGEFYAVAAALAKALYEEWRDPARVAEAVKRLDVYSLALAYLWHVVLGGDEAVARRAAPLILATGFFGPHPPKLAKAVVEALGREPDSAVVKWLSQPLHGTLYEAIEKVAHGAVYRRFGVGSDKLCQGRVEGPCRLVEICAETLVGVPRRRYSGVEEAAIEYAKVIAERLKAPGPDGVRQIDFLIDDFLQAFDSVAEDGRWRVSYKVEEPTVVEIVEDIVDELDILSELYGVASLPVWDPRFNPLKGWFFISSEKVDVFKLYLYPLLKERGEELVKRAVTIVYEARRRGFYTGGNLLRAVGIAAAGLWNNATHEELVKAVELAAGALNHFATVSPMVLVYIKPLLCEAWRRVINDWSYGDRERRQRLADRLTRVAYDATRGYPLSLWLFFAVGVDKVDIEVVAQRFVTLYDAASSAGKLLLLDTLLYTLDWDVGGINVAAMLFGEPQLKPWETLEEVAKRVKGYVSHLNDVERAYVVVRLYPQLAVRYASFRKFNKALEFAEETLKALEELWKAYEEDKASTEKRLRSHLELWQIKPNLERELNKLSLHVYYHVALTYLDVDRLNKAVEYMEKAYELARKFGEVYYEVSSYGLLLRLKAVRGDVPSVEELEKLWQRVLQDVGRLGAEIIATILGKYLVALISAAHLGYVEEVLKEWGWVLGLHPTASALTYGVLSLFDGRYLEKAAGHLSEGARANLSRLADVIHDAVETGLFARDPEVATSAMETLTLTYGKDVIEILTEIAWSDKLFLSALVGLAYCKRGEEWGLKLAKAAARAGSGFEDIVGRLFGELYKALEGASVGNCVTEEVLRGVNKLYYLHI